MYEAVVSNIMCASIATTSCTIIYIQINSIIPNTIKKKQIRLSITFRCCILYCTRWLIVMCKKYLQNTLFIKNSHPFVGFGNTFNMLAKMQNQNAIDDLIRKKN